MEYYHYSVYLSMNNCVFRVLFSVLFPVFPHFRTVPDCRRFPVAYHRSTKQFRDFVKFFHLCLIGSQILKKRIVPVFRICKGFHPKRTADTFQFSTTHTVFYDVDKLVADSSFLKISLRFFWYQSICFYRKSEYSSGTPPFSRSDLQIRFP